MSWAADELARELSAVAGIECDDSLLRWSQDACAALASPSPAHGLSMRAFAEFVASRTRQRHSIFGLVASDLAVAFACAEGEPGVLAYFDRSVLPRVRGAVLRVVGGEAQTDDVLQLVRERVLLGTPPRIATYGGDAPLVSWLRATAVRIALNSIRRKAEEIADDDALHAAPAALDLETDTLKALHRGAFEAAFKASLAALPDRDRALLKLFFVDGVGTEGIGRMYAVNKSTVSRWLAAARAKLLEDTRALLASELHLGESDVRSLVRFIRSRADLSLTSLLR